MKDTDLAYLGGLIDGVGSFEVAVSPHDNYSTGYRFEPKLRLSLHESDTAVLGMLDEYCDEVGVKYKTENRNQSESIRIIIQEPESITRFVDPIGKHFIRKFESARVMLNEILPRVNDDEHLNKQGFYDLMGYVEKLRDSVGRGRDPKYTQNYFAKEWGDEIEI